MTYVKTIHLKIQRGSDDIIQVSTGFSTGSDLNPQRGHSLVKNTRGGGWLDSLGSEILVGKDILGFYKNIDLDNS